jgi:hypothetical protein
MVTQVASSRYVFSDILKKGAQRGVLPGRTQEASNWFRQKARTYGYVDRNQLLREKTQFRSKIVPGSMYMFSYVAKHKDTLPYYDAFPVIFPVEMYVDGFLGINFHYLQPQLRARLMDALYGLVSDPKLTDSAKINLSYQLLKGLSRYKYFQPCLKRYLYSQFRSKFIYVEPETWDIALFLPTESFQGASNNKVWTDSNNGI